MVRCANGLSKRGPRRAGAHETAIAENDAEREIVVPIGTHEQTQDASYRSQTRIDSRTPPRRPALHRICFPIRKTPRFSAYAADGLRPECSDSASDDCVNPCVSTTSNALWPDGPAGSQCGAHLRRFPKHRFLVKCLAISVNHRPDRQACRVRVGMH
jgi:hypothetical protein